VINPREMGESEKRAEMNLVNGILRRFGRGCWPWLFLFAGVVALRVAYLLAIRHWPAFDMPGVDAGENDTWARALAFGDWHNSKIFDVSPMQTSAFYRSPGYPYFLSWVYRVFGGSYLGPRLVQMFLGVAGVVGLAWFGRRWYGAAVGFLAALFAGTYWGLIYFEGELLEPALLVFVDVVMLAALAEAGGSGRLGSESAGRPAITKGSSCAWGFLAGLGLGVHAVTRANVLLFAPLAALWLFGRGVSGSEPRRQRWRVSGPAALLPVVALTLGTLVVVLPVTVRNWRVGGEFVLVSSNGGVNLYIGNNDDAKGLFVLTTQELGEFGTSDVYEGVVEKLERQAGRHLSYGDVDKYFAGKATDWIRTHPGRALVLAWSKFAYLASSWETGHNRIIYWDRRKLPVVRWLPGNWGFFLALAVAGVLIRRKTGRGSLRAFSPVTVLVILFLGSYAVSFLPFFVTGQYRMPLIVWLCLGAAWTVVRMLDALREKSWRSTMPAAVLAGVVYVLSAVNWNGFQPNLPKWYSDEAWAWKLHGEFGRAEESYRQAIAMGGSVDSIWYNLGNLLKDRGDLDQAIQAYRNALAAGLTNRQKAYNNLGACFLQGGRTDEAMTAFGEAVRLEPNNAAFLSNQAMALRLAGRVDEARVALEKVLTMNPKSGSAHLQYGVLLWQAGDKAAAERHFSEAIRLRPEFENMVADAKKSR
jgi:tetratricopeptide (TPR) repeat protein